MPVRWTPENDQLLLLKILETHDLAVDAKKISAAWRTKSRVPFSFITKTFRTLDRQVTFQWLTYLLTEPLARDKGEVPTARAITERLVKIRANFRPTGARHFGIVSAQPKMGPGRAASRPKTTHPSTDQVSTSKSPDVFACTRPADPSDRDSHLLKAEESEQEDMRGQNPAVGKSQQCDFAIYSPEDRQFIEPPALAQNSIMNLNDPSARRHTAQNVDAATQNRDRGKQKEIWAERLNQDDYIV